MEHTVITYWDIEYNTGLNLSNNCSQQGIRILFSDFRFSNYRKFKKPTLDFGMLACTENQSLLNLSRKVRNLQNRTLSNYKIWSLEEIGTFSVKFIFWPNNASRNPLKDALGYKRFTKPVVLDRMVFLHAIKARNNRLKQFFNRLFFWYTWKSFCNFIFFPLRIKTQTCFSKTIFLRC